MGIVIKLYGLLFPYIGFYGPGLGNSTRSSEGLVTASLMLLAVW